MNDSNFWNSTTQNFGSDFWGTNQGVLDAIKNNPGPSGPVGSSDDDFKVNTEISTEVSQISSNDASNWSTFSFFLIFFFIFMVASVITYKTKKFWYFNMFGYMSYAFLMATITFGILEIKYSNKKETKIQIKNNETKITKEGEHDKKSKFIATIILGVFWFVPIFIILSRAYLPISSTIWSMDNKYRLELSNLHIISAIFFGFFILMIIIPLCIIFK
jgi:hypothetical protein